MQTIDECAPKVHNWTGPTGVTFRDVREPSGCYYHDTTPRQVINCFQSNPTNHQKEKMKTNTTDEQIKTIIAALAKLHIRPFCYVALSQVAGLFGASLARRLIVSDRVL